MWGIAGRGGVSVINIDDFIIMKGLEYGLPLSENVTVTQLVHHMGSDARHNPEDLLRGRLSVKPFIPKQRDIAFNVHPNCVNLSSHSHEFVEVNYVYRGSCKQILNNYKELELNEGDVLIIKKGSTHSIELNDGTKDIIINCMLSDQYFARKLLLQEDSNRLIRELGAPVKDKVEERGYFYIPSHKTQNIQLYFKNCIGEFYDPQICSDSIIDSYVTLIMAEMCRAQYANIDDIVNDSKYHLAVEVVSYVRKNLTDVTLESTAKAYHFTPNYLTKLLKSKLNKTFVEIVQEVRLNQAYLQIINTNKTIEEISENVGYRNTYYFTKIFTSRYGCLPSCIRKR